MMQATPSYCIIELTNCSCIFHGIDKQVVLSRCTTPPEYPTKKFPIFPSQF